MTTNPANHTPGPWTKDTEFVVKARFIRGPNQEVIAYCDGPIKQAKKNAALIALAPEMFETLKELMEVATKGANDQSMTQEEVMYWVGKGVTAEFKARQLIQRIEG